MPTSPAQTLWNGAASPTPTLGYSSPELPPLPTLSALQSFPRTPSAVGGRTQNRDGSYFTASWGSPYRNPSPASDRGENNSGLGSDDFDEDSSNLQFGLEHLLPRPLAEDRAPDAFTLEHLLPRPLEEDEALGEFSLEHLLPRRLDDDASSTEFNLNHLIPSRLGASDLTPRSRQGGPNDHTTEWVRQFLEGRWNRASNTWRSDSSSSSSSDSEATQASGNHLLPPERKETRKHKERTSNKTLNQQDFWSFFSQGQKEELGRMMASRFAPEANGAEPSVEVSKEMPAENTQQEKAVSPTAEKANGSLLSPPVMPAKTPSPPPRPRKRVMVKGKGCVISIARDIPRGTPGYPPKPMSPEAVEARLKEFEQDGYDVRGWRYEEGATGAPSNPQNRPIWPDEDQMRLERSSGHRVRVPNRADWDAYVAQLREAKLAALGVSLGGPEESTEPLSAGASLFSPPLPTSSAGSQRMGRQGSIVSGSFPLGPSPGHQSRQSMASPMNFANPRAALHLRGHSTFASPTGFGAQGISPSGAWSPANYFGTQSARGGSPAVPLTRADLADIVSPVSPFGIRPNQQFPLPAQKDDLFMQMQQQQLQAQLLLQQQQQLRGLRPASTLEEVPEDEAEEDEVPAMRNGAQPGPDIAVPVPRGHRHNVSDNLEREARNAEYHLEKAIDKQFDEGGDFSTEPEIVGHPHSSAIGTNSTWEGLHQPQPHNRAHSLAKPQQSAPFGFGSQQEDNPRQDSDGARTNLSDVTNPSLVDEAHDAGKASGQHSQAASISNSWKDGRLAFEKSGQATHSKHGSRSSLSKLNVEAKEFKFNPAATFNPGGFSSTQGKIEPAAPVNGAPSLNVAAPAFKPDAPVFKPTAPVFTPQAPTFKPGAPAFTPLASVPTAPAAPAAPVVPTSGFTFAAQASAFKPDVSPFNPSNTAVPATTPSAPKIFGDVNISESDIIKPAKRSKALPIVRPDKSPARASETKEDEDGRVTQSDVREKRARHGRDDGDTVPKFALQPVLPSQPLAPSRGQVTKRETQEEQEEVPENKENLSPEREATKPKSKSPEPLSLPETTEAANGGFSAPLTGKSTGTFSGTSIEDVAAHESDANESDAATPKVEEQQPFERTHGHKSSLSATAKPFEFRPAAPSGYEFGYHVTKPSNARDDFVDKPLSSPPRWDNRSPATTFRAPSDDGSFRTALETRRRAPYPESESVDFDDLAQMQFNDIDAVMKHMDEGGSDFGVERDDEWDQSSTRLSHNEFDRNDLPPRDNMRSDAPSPSPRRLYAPNMMASPTSINQDPFDDERAGALYDSRSPMRRLRNGEEVPMSDFEDGLLSGEENKLEGRSSFFDNHVERLIGRLLHNRLGPLETHLQGVQDSLALLSHRSSRGRRSLSTIERLESDADDEDDEFSEPLYRNRSPRKDRKLHQIRAVVQEALETYRPVNASLPDPGTDSDLTEKIREVVVDALATQQSTVTPSGKAEIDNVRDIIMETLATQLARWTPPKFEPEQMRHIVEEVIVAHQPVTPAHETIKPEDIRSIVSEVVAANASQPVPEEIRTIISEALAAHAPQPTIIEPIQPDTIRSIVAEALASNHAQALPAPVAEAVQPDMIRSIVEEALASHKPAHALDAPIDIPQPQIDLSELYQIIGSLKASIAQTTSNNVHIDDIREVLDEAFKRQSTEVAKREESQALKEKDERIAALEATLKDTSLRLEEELEARQDLEAREADRAHLLRVTEEELVLLRESASDDENTIRALKEECDVARGSVETLRLEDQKNKEELVILREANEGLKLKTLAFQNSEVDLRKKLDAVTAENEALTFTLEEHRLNANKWRDEIAHAKEDAANMRKAIEQSKFQADEAARVRESMRAKFEKLQQDMVVASKQIAAERAQWQKGDEEHMKKYEVLSARIEAEGRTRERLERELERLETQEREGMKLRMNLEQAQRQCSTLEEIVRQIKQESAEHRKAAEKFQRDYREARETAHIEIRRTRALMEAELEAANNQVNIVRADLEAEITRLRNQLDSVRMDADTMKAKHELEMEAASDSRNNAIDEALRSNKAALDEQYQGFQRRLEQITQEHNRALNMAREDKDRVEAYLKDRLSISDAKMENMQDKISLLEEKLSIAKEAASAAAAAAQSAKSPSAGAPTAYASGAEKISPQALRESIAVLQEQLQEREGRIESLEQQLAQVDTDAPNKLKERDTEITWLRELLGVRIDDISDLINALAQPAFDREAVRDAAIRIRTNLQMEQQEKERLAIGGQSFPTLATISNFASPKAVQLAAAFGNWRKGRENASSSLARTSSNSSRDQTPSRVVAPAAHSFLSGLMTPPTSNLRKTPDLPNKVARPANSRTTSASSKGSVAGFPSLGKQPVPSTPPLMRKSAYEPDAPEDGPFNESGFYDDESTVDGDVTPIGLNFGNVLQHQQQQQQQHIQQQLQQHQRLSDL